MEQTIKVLVVDDEPNARLLLTKLIEEYCPGLSVVGECDSLPNAVKAIRKLKPSLVFLDIEMPGNSGLEILEFFEEAEVDFSVIFTTAYDKYAVRAFKLSAIDYLLKPIDIEELEAAVDRFVKRNAGKEDFSLQRDKIKNLSTGKMAIPIGYAIKFIDVASIVYIKAEGSYSEVYLDNGLKHLVSRTLKNFEDSLDNEAQFFRCHKSYIVNTLFITDYVKSDGGYLILHNGENIPVAQERIQPLLANAYFIKR